MGFAGHLCLPKCYTVRKAQRRVTFVHIVQSKIERLGIEIPSLSDVLLRRFSVLAFSYPEHLGPTHGTYSLSCRFAVLHGHGSRVLYFPACATLHTICFHLDTSYSLLPTISHSLEDVIGAVPPFRGHIQMYWMYINRHLIPIV